MYIAPVLCQYNCRFPGLGHDLISIFQGSIRPLPIKEKNNNRAFMCFHVSVTPHVMVVMVAEPCLCNQAGTGVS